MIEWRSQVSASRLYAEQGALDTAGPGAVRSERRSGVAGGRGPPQQAIDRRPHCTRPAGRPGLRPAGAPATTCSPC